MSTTTPSPDPEDATAVEIHDLDLSDTDPDEDDPQVVAFPPPDIRGATFGLPQQYWRVWQWTRKRRKLAKKGYVSWRLVDGTIGWPKFVKPQVENGRNVPELEHNGTRYLFPREAAIPDQQTGMWTFIHRQGEADPVNLNSPWEHATTPEALDKWLTLGVTADPPSFWDRFDMDAQEVFKWGLIIFMLLVLGQALMGGGLGV